MNESTFQPTPFTFEDFLSQCKQHFFENLYTTFLPDFLLEHSDLFIKEQHGGGVDTVHNVRKMHNDPKITYKNPDNHYNYENNAPYEGYLYHNKNKQYKEKINLAKKQERATGTLVEDGYLGHALTFAKKAHPSTKAHLEHIHATANIHHDRGRILSGLDGPTIANKDSNLLFTNAALNSSMGKDTMEEYLQSNKPLRRTLKPEDENKMLEKAALSLQAYHREINQTYYNSQSFKKDLSTYTKKQGLKMGIRQVVSLYFFEIWMAVEEEQQKLKEQESHSLEERFSALIKGIKIGYQRVKMDKQFLAFFQGARVGVFASITETLINCVITTSKKAGKLLKQSFLSVTTSLQYYLQNPESLTQGQRIKATTQIVTTSCCTVFGAAISSTLSETLPLPPFLSDVIGDFCGIFATSISSVTLLYFLNKSDMMQKIVEKADNIKDIPHFIHQYTMQAEKTLAREARINAFCATDTQTDPQSNCDLAQKISEAKSDPATLNKLLKENYGCA